MQIDLGWTRGRRDGIDFYITTKRAARAARNKLIKLDEH